MHTRLRVRLAYCWVGSLLLLTLLSPRLTVSPLQAAAPSSPATQAGSACPALPPPTGNVVDVSSVTNLINAVNTANPGDTIRLADGTYNFGSGDYLRIDVANVTLRSASGNREAVVLDGNYNDNPGELIQIVASNVTIADLTLREAYYHPIHVMSTSGSDTLNTFIYHVRIIDPREQAIKINPYTQNNPAYFPDNGAVACSHIELTAAGRPNVNTDPELGGCYTGGIDAHQAQGWTIRDNLIEGFWCSTGLSEHGIHMWNNSSGTVVERNRLVDNARGIGFGLGSSGHSGGIIRNNMVHVIQDVGIGLESSPETRVYNNTVYTENYSNSIEYRFTATAGVEIINNLTNQAITSREGGSGTVQDNVTNAQSGWFVSAVAGDLHLASGSLTNVIDQGQTLADVNDDFDGDTRPIGSAPDIGADEYGIPPPAAVTDLRVSNAVTDTGVLTATLRWTAPTDALTTTLRYATVFITKANWNSATLLTDALTGSAEVYPATVPYSGNTVYFALKTEGIGGVSAISNNAFWPHRDIYLPLIFKQ